jgi:hypothetical protein
LQDQRLASTALTSIKRGLTGIATGFSTAGARGGASAAATCGGLEGADPAAKVGGA